jgi:hypothetical protein
MHVMRFALLFFALSLQAAEVPVLVELFTSEGCSSCPPADDLLAKLEKTQPVSGVHLIVLSEHVDYWNRLGWRDPFSSADFTARQTQYSESLKQDGPYTPEAVVDGRSGFVGSNLHDLQQAMMDAVKQPKAKVMLTATGGDGGVNLSVDVKDIPGTKDADVILAITETGLQSNVKGGENSGRLLKHTGVVRRLTVLGRAKGETYSTQTSVVLPKEWKRENLRAVVFVQDRRTKHIVGAATTDGMQLQYSLLR